MRIRFGLAEACLKEQAKNDTRQVTRFIISERTIETKFNCFTEMYYQTNNGRTIARFYFKEV